MPFAATRMDLETVMLSELSQKEEKYHMTSSHMWNLIRDDTNELRKHRLTDLENKLMVARGEGCREGIVGELGMDMSTLLYLK